MLCCLQTLIESKSCFSTFLQKDSDMDTIFKTWVKEEEGENIKIK